MAKLAGQTHKDRVADFNAKLEALSEHHDIPKVRPVKTIISSCALAYFAALGGTWIMLSFVDCLSCISRYLLQYDTVLLVPILLTAACRLMLALSGQKIIKFPYE